MARWNGPSASFLACFLGTIAWEMNDLAYCRVRRSPKILGLDLELLSPNHIIRLDAQDCTTRPTGETVVCAWTWRYDEAQA